MYNKRLFSNAAKNDGFWLPSPGRAEEEQKKIFESKNTIPTKKGMRSLLSLILWYSPRLIEVLGVLWTQDPKLLFPSYKY